MRLTIVNDPVGLGDDGAPTATGNTVTTSFSINASLRSEILTTSRRWPVVLAARGGSAADADPDQNVIATVAAAIQPLCVALISSSTLRTKRATAQPADKLLIKLWLTFRRIAGCVSRRTRQGTGDTNQSGDLMIW